MKIYNSVDEFEALSNAVVTIGTFDGVHFGHQKIIKRLKEISDSVKGQTVILTFFPHPRMILHPEENQLKLINSIDEKIELLAQLNIDHLLIIPFNRDFSNLNSLQFIEEILVKAIGTKKLVIGYDHRFGKDREGSFEHLMGVKGKYGFEVEEITEQDVNDVAVSSTKIRNALFAGDIRTANAFLGYDFMLSGVVVKGDKIGRTMGYPTANLFVPETYKLIPGDGIYGVEVDYKEQTYKGMLYIGQRPTINGMTRNIEVNIFDFDKEIYNEKLCIRFKSFIRSDERFENLEALKQQLHKDKEATLRFFNTGS